MTTALVTGASSGLGAEFARQLAAKGCNLVLVARDSTRLEQLARELGEQYRVSVEVFAADLASDAGCSEVEARLNLSERPVELLVNNAGLALKQRFSVGSIEDEEHMLRLNVRAVMRLTHAFLPRALARESGGVLNVASVAAFGAVSPGSTYSSTKAWVTNFSESLHIALSTKGIQVMALCPGLVHTEFHQRAGLPSGKPGSFWWLDAEMVVRKALRDFRRGKSISVPTFRYKLLVGLLRHLPRRLLYATMASARATVT